MRAHSFVVAVFMVLAAVVAGRVEIASAQPGGLFVSGQTCSANGTVQVLLNWTPEGNDLQFVDISTQNDEFRSFYSKQGPYLGGTSQALLTSLLPQTTYHTRVSTRAADTFRYSASIPFTTMSCGTSATQAGSATPPVSLQAAAFSATGARFQWTPGKGNRYFCVDYARTMNDLLSRQGGWRNSGCGTTANSHVLNNLACGTTYFARVWTPSGGGLYSAAARVTTYDCSTAISAPSELRVVFETAKTVRLTWKPGKDNRWFCVDTARSESDLLSFSGTWRNYACGTTATELTITGLRCDTQYFWRVYAWNLITNVHSATKTFHTDKCSTELVKAPIEDVDVDRVHGEYRATIVVGLPDSCHRFGWYELEQSGTLIEITVYNSVSNDAACAQVYGTYELVVGLGSDFIGGVRYTVIVNDDELDRFVAQ